MTLAVPAAGGRIERALSRIVARGSERRDFLDRMVTNDLSRLAPGQGAPTFLLERTGRVVDRLLVLERGDDTLLLGSPGRAPAVLEYLLKYVIAADVELRDVSGETGVITVVGATAADLLTRRFGVPVAELRPWEHRHAAPPFEAVTLVRAEDVGGRSFHVIAPRGAMASVAAGLAELPSLDEAAYRALRIDAGVPAFGEEFTERSIPLELRALDHISFTKGCYVGQEVIARLHNFHRVKRALVRLRIEGGEAPSAGAELMDGEQVVGNVASAASAGSSAVALGFVEAGQETPGRYLALRDGERRRQAHILTLTPSGDPS